MPSSVLGIQIVLNIALANKGVVRLCILANANFRVKRHSNEIRKGRRACYSWRLAAFCASFCPRSNLAAFGYIGDISQDNVNRVTGPRPLGPVTLE